MFFFFWSFRNNFKFFTEMDEIFRKELKADSSCADMFAAEDPDDCVETELNQQTGEKKLWFYELQEQQRFAKRCSKLEKKNNDLKKYT